jgi:chromosome segregation ATPase
MQSVQESKQELQASIRYAENAISSAKATIESMEFRQEMAKKQQAEQTGREEALTKQVQELEERNDELNMQIVEQTNREATLEREVAELRDIIDRMGDDITGDSVTIRQQDEQIHKLMDESVELKNENKKLRDEVENLRIQVVDQADFDLLVRDAVTDFILAIKTTGMEIDE